MPREYKPRRCSKRWLDGDCPAGVLAILDHPDSFDRYTVFYADDVQTDGRDTWIGYRGMSQHPTAPSGFGIYGQMRAHEVAEYRYRQKHHYAKWSDLPPDVQALVRRDTEELAA